ASATFEEMLAAQKTVLASSDRALVFASVEVNPLRPIVAKGIKLDIVVTWTRDDAAPFVALRHKGKPFGGMIDDETTTVATRSFISGTSETLATTLRKAGHQVTTYEITWRPRGSPYGATDCYCTPIGQFFFDGIIGCVHQTPHRLVDQNYHIGAYRIEA